MICDVVHKSSSIDGRAFWPGVNVDYCRTAASEDTDRARLIAAASVSIPAATRCSSTGPLSLTMVSQLLSCVLFFGFQDTVEVQRQLPGDFQLWLFLTHQSDKTRGVVFFSLIILQGINHRLTREADGRRAGAGTDAASPLRHLATSSLTVVSLPVKPFATIFLHIWLAL